MASTPAAKRRVSHAPPSSPLCPALALTWLQPRHHEQHLLQQLPPTSSRAVLTYHDDQLEEDARV